MQRHFLTIFALILSGAMVSSVDARGSDSLLRAKGRFGKDIAQGAESAVRSQESRFRGVVREGARDAAKDAFKDVAEKIQDRMRSRTDDSESDTDSERNSERSDSEDKRPPSRDERSRAEAKGLRPQTPATSYRSGTKKGVRSGRFDSKRQRDVSDSESSD